MKIKGFLHVKFSFFYRRHKPDIKLILNKDRITVKVVDGNWNTIDYHGKFLPLCFTPHQSILKVILVIISYLPHAVGCIFLTLMLTCVFEKCTAARGTNFNIFFFFCNDKKKKRRVSWLFQPWYTSDWQQLATGKVFWSQTPVQAYSSTIMSETLKVLEKVVSVEPNRQKIWRKHICDCVQSAIAHWDPQSAPRCFLLLMVHACVIKSCLHAISR